MFIKHCSTCCVLLGFLLLACSFSCQSKATTAEGSECLGDVLARWGIEDPVVAGAHRDRLLLAVPGKVTVWSRENRTPTTLLTKGTSLGAIYAWWDKGRPVVIPYDVFRGLYAPRIWECGAGVLLISYGFAEPMESRTGIWYTMRAHWMDMRGCRLMVEVPFLSLYGRDGTTTCCAFGLSGVYGDEYAIITFLKYRTSVESGLLPVVVSGETAFVCSTSGAVAGVGRWKTDAAGVLGT